MSEIKQSNWLPYLDGWRGIAVTLVLLGHFFPVPGINAGRLGVELFFCLSGRLMAEILFVKQPKLDRFFVRRIARVWPGLYVFIVLGFVAFNASGPLQILISDAIAGVTFTSNYWGILGHRSPTLDHLWSLSVEEWSYCALALCSMIYWKFGVRPALSLGLVSALCVISGVASTLLGQGYYEVYWRTDVRMASIFLPAIVYLYLRDVKVAPFVPLVFGSIGVLLNIIWVPDPVKYTLGTIALSISVCTVGSAYSFIISILEYKWIRQIGIWSFSLYLWQQPFAKTEGNVFLRLSAVFVISYLSYKLVESPCRVHFNRLYEKWVSRRTTCEA